MYPRTHLLAHGHVQERLQRLLHVLDGHPGLERQRPLASARLPGAGPGPAAGVHLLCRFGNMGTLSQSYIKYTANHTNTQMHLDVDDDVPEHRPAVPAAGVHAVMVARVAPVAAAGAPGPHRGEGHGLVVMWCCVVLIYLSLSLSFVFFGALALALTLKNARGVVAVALSTVWSLLRRCCKSYFLLSLHGRRVVL